MAYTRSGHRCQRRPVVRVHDIDACTQHAQQVTRTANAVTRRATERSGGTFVDVTRTVCLRQRCPLVVDGVVTYRDSAHISLTWSLRLTRDLARSLRLPYP